MLSDLRLFNEAVAERTLGFVLHLLDEQVHHGAELGVLRDLSAATVTTRS